SSSHNIPPYHAGRYAASVMSSRAPQTSQGENREEDEEGEEATEGFCSRAGRDLPEWRGIGQRGVSRRLRLQPRGDSGTGGSGRRRSGPKKKARRISHAEADSPETKISLRVLRASV